MKRPIPDAAPAELNKYIDQIEARQTEVKILDKTLARAYLCIDQQWNADQPPAACGNYFITKGAILAELKAAHQVITNTQLPSQYTGGN